MSEDARSAVGDYKAGWHDPENATIRFDFGLSEQVVRDISALKNEPEWMTEIRVKAFHHFNERPMPTWGFMMGRVLWTKSGNPRSSKWQRISLRVGLFRETLILN